MALAISKLGTSIFSTANVSPYTFAAVTPTGSAGIVLGTVTSATSAPGKGTPDVPTWLDGAWTEETDVTQGSDNMRLTTWSGKTIASPGSDSVDVSVTGSPTGCCIIVVQATGQDTTDFVLQPETSDPGGTGTSASATLNGALAGTDSACLAFIAHNTNEDQVPTGGETELDDGGHSAPTRRLSAQFEINDTVTGANWTTASTRLIAAMELKAAAAAIVLPPSPLIGRDAVNRSYTY